MTAQKSADEQFCRSCGELIKKRAEFCPHCGVSPESSSGTTGTTAYCSACGDSVAAEAELCPNCGTRTDRTRRPDWLDHEWLTKSNVLTGLGVLFLVSALSSLTDGGPLLASVSEAVIFGCIGALLLPQVRKRTKVRHPVSTFGRTRSIDEHLVERGAAPCSICHESVDDGVERTYSEEFVVFGVSLFTFEKGENRYCNDCLSDEGLR